MSIEVDCCCPKKRIDDRVVNSSIISSGDWAGVSLLGGKIRIAVINSVDGDRGSILIRGKTEKIRAILYEDGYDNEGKRVNPTEPIVIKRRQIASIETKKCKPKRKVLVYSANY